MPNRDQTHSTAIGKTCDAPDLPRPASCNRRVCAAALDPSRSTNAMLNLEASYWSNQNISPIFHLYRNYMELLNVILGAPYVSQAPFKRSRSAELSPSSSSSSCFTPGITCSRSLELWSILEGFPAIWACTFQTQSSMLLHRWFEFEVPQPWWLHPHMCCFRSGKNEKRASNSVQKPT